MRSFALLVGALALATTSLAAPPDHVYDLRPELPREPLRVVGGVTPISQIAADAPDGSAALGEFSFVTVRGVIQHDVGALNPFSAPSDWTWIADETGSVALAAPFFQAVNFAAGDSVEVSLAVFTQRSTPLRGTRSLDLTFLSASSVLATGRPVKAPVVVAASDLLNDGGDYEASLVTVNGLTIVDAGEWPAAGTAGFVRVTDGTDEIRLYVDANTDIGGNPPSGAFDLTGFVAQDDPDANENPPYVDGHYLYPRSIDDFSQGDGSGLATIAPTSVVVDDTGRTVDVTVTGQDVSLGEIEVLIPTNWLWATPGDLTLSGPGLTGATTSFRAEGLDLVAVISGAAITSSAPGTISIGSLDTPSVAEVSTFVVRTATTGGTPIPITTSPSISVVSGAQPGDVVINELYPVARLVAGGSEPAEFIELRNVSSAPIFLDLWTLQDIGRVAECTLGARWAFPPGTRINPGEYLVVCRAARDPAQPAVSFLGEFPAFPATTQLFEMYDPNGGATGDHPDTPNLLLLDGTPGNDQIVLLGGNDTNVGQCSVESVPDVEFPFWERVVLTDAIGGVVDVVQYREIGPCAPTICPDDGLEHPEDAYPWGAPIYRHSLGRDAASSDTDVSANDIIPSSAPSPGQINVPGDTQLPELSIVSSDIVRSATVFEVEFNEPVDEASALDPANYRILVNNEPYAVEAVRPSVVKVQNGQVVPVVGRSFFLQVEPVPAAQTGSIRITGVRDLVVNGTGGNLLDATFPIQTRPGISSYCQVQEFDEVGLSPALGDTVIVTGLVTLGDIPPYESGELVPIDRLSIWAQEPGGCGANLFSFFPDDPIEYQAEYPDIARFGVRLNDMIEVRGTVVEFISGSSGAGAVTEIALLDQGYKLLSRGLEGPAPIEVSTNGVNDERLEGTLVRTRGTIINSNSLAAWIDDGSGSTQVFQNFGSLDLTRYKVGDRVDVTGIITQFDSSEPYFSGYELVPQNQDAIFLVEGNGFAPSNSPTVNVEKRVLVPDQGEKIRIETIAPQRTKFVVEIFDAVGRKENTLYDGVGLGTVVFEWDGRNQYGATVEPGVYLCRVRAVSLDGGPVINHTAPIVVGLRLEGGGR